MEKWVANLRLWTWVMTATILAAGLGVWLIARNQMPPQIPLWYSQPWGESQLAGPEWLLIMPGMGAGAGVGGGLVLKKLERYVPLAVMMAATIVVMQAILLLGMLRIVLVII